MKLFGWDLFMLDRGGGMRRGNRESKRREESLGKEEKEEVRLC